MLVAGASGRCGTRGSSFSVPLIPSLLSGKCGCVTALLDSNNEWRWTTDKIRGPDRLSNHAFKFSAVPARESTRTLYHTAHHPTTPTTDYTTAMCTHIIHLPYQWQDKTPRLACESDDAIMHQDKTTAGGQQACGPRLELLRRDKTIDLAALSYRWQAIFWAFFCLRLLSVARLPSDSCTRVFTH
jgi:hypothetical protein